MSLGHLIIRPSAQNTCYSVQSTSVTVLIIRRLKSEDDISDPDNSSTAERWTRMCLVRRVVCERREEGKRRPRGRRKYAARHHMRLQPRRALICSFLRLAGQHSWHGKCGISALWTQSCRHPGCGLGRGPGPPGAGVWDAKNRVSPQVAPLGSRSRPAPQLFDPIRAEAVESTFLWSGSRSSRGFDSLRLAARGRQTPRIRTRTSSR